MTIVTDFAYQRPGTVAEAVRVLAGQPAATVVLAGGQSLLPAMKTGRLRPDTVLDIGRLSELGGVAVHDGRLTVGALVRHHDLAGDPLVRRHAPLLAHTAGLLGDPQVRHRGTVGGSLCWAAPAADLPAALLALDAAVVLTGPVGSREVPLGDFVTGAGRTVREPGELLSAVSVPLRPGARWSYQRFGRDALQWPLAIVAAVRPSGDAPVTVALGNLADRPVRATAVPAALAAGATAAQAAELAAGDTQAHPDPRASADYRRHLAGVLTARALAAIGF